MVSKFTQNRENCMPILERFQTGNTTRFEIDSKYITSIDLINGCSSKFDLDEIED